MIWQSDVALAGDRADHGRLAGMRRATHRDISGEPSNGDIALLTADVGFVTQLQRFPSIALVGSCIAPASDGTIPSRLVRFTARSCR